MPRVNSEAGLTAKLKHEIERLGGVMITVSGNRFSSGWPDRTVLHRLWSGVLEIKTGRRQCTPQQRANIRRAWISAPGRVFVVRLEPGLNGTIENEDGDTYAGGEFDNVQHLLMCLNLLWKSYNQDRLVVE